MFPHSPGAAPSFCPINQDKTFNKLPSKRGTCTFLASSDTTQMMGSARWPVGARSPSRHMLPMELLSG